MGEYSYAFNILNLSFQVFSLTIYSSYLRFIYEYDQKNLVKIVNIFSFISFFAYAIVVLIFFDSYLFIPFAFIILLNERLYFFRAMSKVSKYNIINIAQKFLFLFLIVIYIYFLNFEASGSEIIFFLGLSYLLVYLISLKGSFVWQGAESKDKVNKRNILTFSILGMASGVLNWILTVSDQMIIEWYYGFESLAPYAVSFRIVSLVGLVTGIFISYYPSMYFEEFKNKRFDSAILFRRYFLFFLIFLVVLLYIFSDFVYFILGASSYSNEKGYFHWLLLGEFFRVVASIFFTFRTYKLEQKTIIISLFVISVLNVTLNIIFIPLYGPIAAAITTSFCFALHLIISIFFSVLPENKYILRNSGVS